MLKIITRPFKYIYSIIREKNKSRNRSAKWNNVRDNFIKSNPFCAACGTKEKLQVHHISPFYLHPELELDEKNLISLCMSKNECHLAIGHGGSFRYYNPRVTLHAKRFFIEKNKKVKESIIELCKIMREK